MQTPIDLKDQNEGYFQGCAHFGLQRDPATRVLYPTPEAVCHAGKRPVAVDEAYQQQHCLTAGHVVCPVFQQAQPPELHPADYGQVRRSLRTRLTAGLLITLVALFALGSWVLYRSEQSVFAQDAAPPTAVPVRTEPDTQSEDGAFQPVTYSAESLTGP